MLDSQLVFRAAELQRNRSQMFGREYPCRNAINVLAAGLRKRFCQKRLLGWQKLNGPAANDNVGSVGDAAAPPSA